MSSSDAANGAAEPGPDAVPATGTASRVRQVISRTLGKAWDDDIFSHSAQAAFWQVLSLPSLLLALLGLVGYLTSLFGQQAMLTVDTAVIGFSRRVFTQEVVEEIIAPTANTILTNGRADVVSVGFIVALWTGSSAVASIVDSITHAHNQKLVRHPVWQRIFSLLIYLFALVVAILTLPLLALGPELLPAVLPEAWRAGAEELIRSAYYPVTGLILVIVLTTLYHVALPHSLPWRRLLPGALLAMVVFITATTALRFYITLLTASGYTYGALASPIAFLLFAFMLGLAIVLGAHLNNAVEEVWPSGTPRGERRSVRFRAAAVRSGGLMTRRNPVGWTHADLRRHDQELPKATPVDHARSGSSGSGPTSAKEPG